jgi:inosose dehydratase
MMLDRVAAAPISWGICEVPGWGLQLPVDRVLQEMSSLGIRATELGAIGWLPTDPAEIRDALSTYGLQLVGGFVPLVLHDPSQWDTTRAAVSAAAARLSEAGGSFFITAAVSDPAAWQHLLLDDGDWSHLLDKLGEVDEIVSGHGLTQVVHPHVDTLIETADEVQRFLDGSSVGLCLDTGHLFIGGADSIAIVNDYFERIGVIHLKDVSAPIAARLRAGELTLMTATQAGLFPALGSGDVPISGVIRRVEQKGFRGWYVIEQDVALTDGEPPIGEGPVLGVSESVAYVRELAASRSDN